MAAVGILAQYEQHGVVARNGAQDVGAVEVVNRYRDGTRIARFCFENS